MEHHIEELRVGRAVATAVRLEDDDSFMVHEQLARLRFVLQHVKVEGMRVLDFGSGSGYVLDYLYRMSRPASAMGVDIDPAVVDFARSQCPHLEFVVRDASAPGLDLGRRFDVVFSFEVLEHVADQETYLKNLVRHLHPGGTAVISTPNRDIFSLGEAHSLHNPTHQRELKLVEFASLLSRFLGNIEIHGQCFSSSRMQRLYLANTRQLLWKRRVRSQLESHMTRANPLLKLYYRVEDSHDRYRAKHSPLKRVKWNDFAFRAERLEGAIWFISLGKIPTAA